MHPLITDCLDHLAAGTLPATTLKALRGDLATLERWYTTARGRPLRLEDVTPRDVDACQGLAPRYQTDRSELKVHER